MLHVSMGLIDKTGEVDANTLSAAAAAINVQVNRDLAQYWNVSASISALSAEGGVPPGLWPVFIVPAIKDAGGFHLTKHNQPYAEVAYGPGWTIAASHEVCEMLVDPSGNRLQPSLSIDLKSSRIVDGAGTFEYLVEVCDPSESPDNAYSIAGVTVSDFYTPHFYDPMAVAGTRYDFTGAIKAPRQVLKGGYLSWFNSSINALQQLKWLDGAPKIVTAEGKKYGSSLREFVDSITRTTPKISQTPKTQKALRFSNQRAEFNAKVARKRMELYPERE
jgi:hypothetical protein